MAKNMVSHIFFLQKKTTKKMKIGDIVIATKGTKQGVTGSILGLGGTGSSRKWSIRWSDRQISCLQKSLCKYMKLTKVQSQVLVPKKKMKPTTLLEMKLKVNVIVNQVQFIIQMLLMK